MGKLFGTDGIRGIVPTELDALLALKIGASTARVLGKKKEEKITLLIGSDTRISKDVLKHALISGVLSENADVVDLGIIPTPAVSHLIKIYGADGGFVISASHNPYEYNGIKVFNDKGMKLDDEIEEEIENIILEDFEMSKCENGVGTYRFEEQAKEDYVDFLASSVSCSFGGIKIGVDVANGAAYETAKMLFERLGVEYMIMNDEPDGYNINRDAGSTHLDGLVEFVKTNHLDLGIAFDGDADRCLVVDEEGSIVDGDKIMAICGRYLKGQGKLKNDAIVGTVMSNLGLAKFCTKEGINFIQTKVGDRYVLENMLANGYNLGGEQSGHIIFKDFANTGDGELTALQILMIRSTTKKKMSELASVMDYYPQVLKNVDVSKYGKEHYSENEKIMAKIHEVEDCLGDEGRVLVRPSGTENLIRVMLEGKDVDSITKYCEEIVQVVKNENI